MGTIQWNKRTQVATKQSSWYDHTYFDVPFTGAVDLPKMRSALVGRLTHQFLNKFGGQVHVGVVELAHTPGVLRVEQLYSIGD